MNRKAVLHRVRRIVLKVGTRVLTAKGKTLSQVVFDRLAREVSAAKKKGYEIVIVSSGAIAAGMARLGLLEKPRTIPQKQAAAALGQNALMWNYERAFSFYEEKVAQILLTRDDLSNRNRYLNARNTLLTLLGFGVIPVINENDTVAVEEIKFGDNDNLSALVTNLVNADLLIILSDIDGLFDCDPRLHKNARLIPFVSQITSEMEKKATGTLSSISIGGMVTKLQAARKAALFGVPSILA
ncbi:MAG: glutamate 5-kinase, partial [Deltaproteobacteria bacterium RBG_19FT_COMBO_52_11]